MSPRDALWAALALALSDELGAATVPALWEELSASADPTIDSFSLEDLQVDLQRVLLARLSRDQAVRVLRKTFAGLVTIAGSDEQTKVSASATKNRELGRPPSNQEVRRTEQPSIVPRPTRHKVEYVEHSEVAVIVAVGTIDEMCARASSGRFPYLVILTGPQLGQTLELRNLEAILGRSSSCDLVVSDEGVSRMHAKFVLKGPNVALVDLGSTNGTFVNEERIANEAMLQHGDHVRLFNTALKFFNVAP